MILSGQQIKKALLNGRWGFNGDINSLHFGPNSVDVTLSGNWLNPYNKLVELDPQKPNDLAKLYTEYNEKEISLVTKGFILTSVKEAFDTLSPLWIREKWRYFIPMYEGRSTLARLGLQSHLSAGFGDYGFKGSFTLEIVNHAPWDIILREGMRIGQVYFIETDEAVRLKPYKGYDQTDCKATMPKLGPNRL